MIANLPILYKRGHKDISHLTNPARYVGEWHRE